MSDWKRSKLWFSVAIIFVPSGRKDESRRDEKKFLTRAQKCARLILELEMKTYLPSDGFAEGENEMVTKLLKISANVDTAEGKKKVSSTDYPELATKFVGADPLNVSTPADWKLVYDAFRAVLTEYVRDEKGEIVRDGDKAKERELDIHEFVSKYFVAGLNQRLSADYRIKLIEKAEGPMGFVNRQVAAAMKFQEVMPEEMRQTEEQWRQYYLAPFIAKEGSEVAE